MHKSTFYYAVQTIVIFLIKLVISKKCPPSESIYPCVCNENFNTLDCYGTTNFNIKLIFESLSNNLAESDKHFKHFNLNNTAITELVTDAFHDITFEAITIYNAQKLTKISSNAFTATNYYTETFAIYNTPIMDNDGDYNVFHALSLMNNLEYVYIGLVNLTKVPTNAFRPLNGAHNKLTRIDINFNEHLRSIGNNSFYYLNNLEELFLCDNVIDYIPAHAFDFQNKSNKTMRIDLSDNRLNSSSFSWIAFNAVNRPFELELGDNKNLKYLDENIFSPVLSRNNSIDLSGNALTCDCRMYWIVKHTATYAPLIHNAVCTDGKSILIANRAEFINC